MYLQVEEPEDDHSCCDRRNCSSLHHHLLQLRWPSLAELCLITSVRRDEDYKILSKNI